MSTPLQVAQTQQEPQTLSQPIAGSMRFEWTMIILGCWFMAGILLDGWAHRHIPQLETFFTPWHAVLNSGYLAVAPDLYSGGGYLRCMQATFRSLARAKGLSVTVVASQGSPGDVLVKHAEEQEADVLVVGNKGMHRRVLGSVPNSVAHSAHCTVILVKTV